jgi:DNA-3-methyladenine glycosylase
MQGLPARLTRDDFNRPTLQVARALLGKALVRNHRGRRYAALITEVEAYKAPRDRASHAYGGLRSKRVEPIYGDGGTAYVYLCYGVHWLLNIATAGKDKPECVLIRGVVADPLGERRPISGPGRVTRFFNVDKRLDHADLTASDKMWVEEWGIQVPAYSVHRGPRVGVEYAGSYWAMRPWRFWIELKGQTKAGAALTFTRARPSG